MKESINLTLTDLDNYELTLKQLNLMFEKILLYYGTNDGAKFTQFVSVFLIYFQTIYKLIIKPRKEKL